MNLENKIIELTKNEYRYVKDKKIVNLLKIVLVDNETNLDKIVKNVPINALTIKKYVEEKDCILQFLSEEEFLVFKNKIDKILDLEQEQRKKDELNLITRIIDEIFSTRHKMEDICANNFFPCERFKTILSKTTYVEENFSLKVKEEVKRKIEENAKYRNYIPKGMILIQDRYQVFVAKEDVVYLDRLDYKNLEYVSDYLCSGANLDFMVNKYEINKDAALRLLENPKIEKIIKPKYYEDLKRYIAIERLLLDGTLEQKRDCLKDFVSTLIETNFNKEIIMDYYQITEYLMNKFLLEIIKNPDFNDKIKTEIKLFLGLEEEKKIK